MEFHFGTGKHIIVRMPGSVLKSIAKWDGMNSMISLPVVGAKKAFRLEIDLVVGDYHNTDEHLIDDDGMYDVIYQKSPEDYYPGYGLYATVYEADDSENGIRAWYAKCK